jgi:hypothetical protein
MPQIACHSYFFFFVSLQITATKKKGHFCDVFKRHYSQKKSVANTLVSFIWRRLLSVVWAQV